MSSHNNRHLLAGTPAGVQRSKNPVSVRKLKMDFNEPFYTNNKVGNEYFTLEKSCGNTCEICPMLDIASTVIVSTVNKRKFPVLTNQKLSWKSRNIVYVLTCNICGYQYVGETEQTLAARINGHKRGVRHGSSEEYLHFSCDDTHRNVEVNEKFKIQIAEKIFENDNPDKKKAKARRLQRETAWIYKRFFL